MGQYSTVQGKTIAQSNVRIHLLKVLNQEPPEITKRKLKNNCRKLQNRSILQERLKAIAQEKSLTLEILNEKIADRVYSNWHY